MLEPLVVTGDLIDLSAQERIQFYVQNCEALGLNPLTRPLQYFEQIDRNGKHVLILYALRAAAAQLAAKRNLSTLIVNQNPTFANDVAVFEATVKDSTGRSEMSVGVQSLRGLSNKEYADAIMAAQTKAKRRAILDFVGCGLLDETEVEGMHGSVVEVSVSDLQGYVAIPKAPEIGSTPAIEAEDFFKIKSITLGVQQPNVRTAPVHLELKPEELPGWVPASVKLSEPIAVPPEVFEARERLRANAEIMTATITMPPPETPKVVPPTKEDMETVVARLTVYRKEVLQNGGMKPSKGLGIGMKWQKFLAKHASDKTVAQYVDVLVILDNLLHSQGAEAVVSYVEKEIA